MLTLNQGFLYINDFILNKISVPQRFFALDIQFITGSKSLHKSLALGFKVMKLLKQTE